MSEKIWISVCELDDILPDTGVCALVKEQQVAIFRSRRLNELFAVGNYDPIGEANVLSRGWLSLHRSTKNTSICALASVWKNLNTKFPSTPCAWKMVWYKFRLNCC